MLHKKQIEHSLTASGTFQVFLSCLGIAVNSLTAFFSFALMPEQLGCRATAAWKQGCDSEYWHYTVAASSVFGKRQMVIGRINGQIKETFSVK